MAEKSSMPLTSASRRSASRILRIAGWEGLSPIPAIIWRFRMVLPPRLTNGPGGDADVIAILFDPRSPADEPMVSHLPAIVVVPAVGFNWICGRCMCVASESLYCVEVRGAWGCCLKHVCVG